MVFCLQQSRIHISRAVWRILVGNSLFIFLCRFTLLLGLFFTIGQVAAGTLSEKDKSVRSIVSGIVSYTHWPSLAGQPKLCIFASSRFTQALKEEPSVSLPYFPVVVHNDQEALYAPCDAIYFGNESPAYQVELIRKFHSRPLLLIAEQNPECLIGSAFCLIISDDRVRFSVNLDALSRSGVRVNPDVLMLARNTKHE